MKKYPDRRPMVGETVRNIDDGRLGVITRVRAATNRSYYIVGIHDESGCYDSYSTCWIFSMPTLTSKPKRELRSTDEVMKMMAEEAPHLVERCFMDRNWIWICNVDLRGDKNLPTREAIKRIGFRFSPGGHLMPDQKTRGHWGHSCEKPMGPRRRKGGIRQPDEEEETTDMAAAFRALGF